MFGTVLRHALKVRPVVPHLTRTVTSNSGLIAECPPGINKLGPLVAPVVVAAGIYCGAKASEYGAWLLKEFSLFEYEDDDDDDD